MYLRSFFWTVLFPAYSLALIFYGSAFLLSPASPLNRMVGGTFFYVGGVVVFLGLSRLLSYAGFVLSGIPRRRTLLSSTQRQKLEHALGVLARIPVSEGGRDNDTQAALTLSPVPLDLGPAVYLSVGGVTGRELWISTALLEVMEPDDLVALIAHEAGHVARERPGCSIHWKDAVWLLAYPLAIILSFAPLLILAVALVHAQLWVHLESMLQHRREVQADRFASSVVGRKQLIRALARYFVRSGPRRKQEALKLRLRELGVAEEELEHALRDAELWAANNPVPD